MDGNGKDRPPDRPGKSISYDQIEPILGSNYLIKNVIAAGSLAMFVGASGDGKSFLAIDAMMAIATGEPWFGHRLKKGLVVYFAAEGGIGINNRFAAIKLRRGITTAPVELIKCGLDLMSPESCEAVIQEIKVAQALHGEKCAAIVFDTLARCMRGDENSPEDMSAAIRGADYIRGKTGSAAILVHHLGKDVAKGARGHSSLKAAVDTEITFEMRDQTRVAKTTKQRDFESGIEFVFDLEQVHLGTDQDGDAVTSCIVRPLVGDEIPVPARHMPRGAAQLKLYRHLQELVKDGGKGVWTAPELRKFARDMGITKTTAQELPFALSATGHLTNIGGAYAFVSD